MGECRGRERFRVGFCTCCVRRPWQSQATQKKWWPDAWIGASCTVQVPGEAAGAGLDETKQAKTCDLRALSGSPRRARFGLVWPPANSEAAPPCVAVTRNSGGRQSHACNRGDLARARHNTLHIIFASSYLSFVGCIKQWLNRWFRSSLTMGLCICLRAQSMWPGWYWYKEQEQ
jgi:hypothetical protein